MRTSKVIHVVSCHAEGEVGDVITFNIHQLLLHYAYQVAVQFSIGSTVYERYLIIHCQEAS